MKALDTSLRILTAFTGERTVWTVTALAESLELGTSLVSKNLAAFRDAGFLAQDPATKAYSAGISAFALGAQYLNNNPLVHESSGVLRRLADTTGQTSSLCKLSGIDVLHLASVEGPHFVDIGWRVGTWLPFHATAVGKVLYAFSSDALLEEALASRPLTKITASTISSAKALKTQFAEIRKRGYSSTSEETMSGLGAQAVPIFNANQEAVAALGLVYPLRSFTKKRSDEQLHALHAGARTISLRIGCSFYPFGESAQ